MSVDQGSLAKVVKGLHRKLKKDLKENGDFATVWDKHCSDRKALEKYAEAMHSLATLEWTKNSPGGRADWCYQVCMEYFKGGGLKMAIEKQQRRVGNKMASACCCCCMQSGYQYMHNWPSVDKKFPLLDVGSCYNPFSEFGEFHSVALDLQPATEKVYKCDFLKLEIVENQVASGLAASNSKTSNDTGGSKDSMMSSQENCQCLASNLITSKLNLPSDSSITHLPASSFQVVVFSLLLSYFPTPIQRWDCCLKAHQLLSVNGILIIITPDSSHQNRNAAMMKSWKLGIESLGFIRWKYVKQTHVHCMVFRKVSPCHTKDKTTKVLHVPEMLYTRQDYTGNDSDDSDSDRVKNNETRPEETDKELAKLFDELPAFD
ncbi:S-adenosylmethionine sensor upstream of mTORC1 [Nematostella vectensis]|uniref:S-adenosylmethionine sensor upstream of mTORC1 n=1 Tax=Nematostella vectensis TaxID=45351 RepID=UPI0020775844|nr:S-adenosylmethionine sensor upstream of mTORC1 [Nematostella vectensis]